MNEKTQISVDENDLEEGHLYVVKNGELQEIETDPEDTMRKLRLSEDAVKAVTKVQKSIRKLLGGYKPDLTFIASALLVKAAKNEATSQEAVKEYYKDVVSKLD
jgi:anthranilate phosphoribosyltransferase